MTLPAVSHTIRIINLLTKQERRVELEHTSLSLLQPTIAMLLQSPSVPYILVTEDGKIASDSYFSANTNREITLFLLHYKGTSGSRITGIRTL